MYVVAITVWVTYWFVASLWLGLIVVAIQHIFPVLICHKFSSIQNYFLTPLPSETFRFVMVRTDF